MKRMRDEESRIDCARRRQGARIWRPVWLVYLIAIPLTLALGVWLFADRRYNLISILVALLSCVPFFVRFERGAGVGEMVLVSVMTAFSVVGRLAFSLIPSFKPVTAITMIAGIALGPESGFLVGSLSAVVSNIFFGQGPWTPFQMLAWGLIGFLCGILFRKRTKPNLLLLSGMGILGGVLFSALMDIWTALSIDGYFLPSRYLACILSSLPVTMTYAASNVVFLLLLARPLLARLERIRIKYFQND